MIRKKNRWKTAFFVLIGLIIISILGVVMGFFMLTRPASEGGVESSSSSEISQENQITVNTTVDLETVMQLLNQRSLPYRFSLNNKKEVVIQGDITVYGRALDFQLTGTPSADSEGNIRIKITQFELSQLNIPLSLFLPIFSSILGNDAAFSVNNDTEELIIRLNRLIDGDEVKVSVTQLSLDQDQISLKLSLPQTLLDEWLAKQ